MCRTAFDKLRRLAYIIMLGHSDNASRCLGLSFSRQNEELVFRAKITSASIRYGVFPASIFRS